MDMEQRQTAVHERFLAAREAYEVLADPAARNRYHASRRNQNQPVAHTVDPWAAERPRPGPPQTPAEAQYERAARWGLLGFIGVLLLVAGAQQQLAYEEYLQRQGAEHLLSVRLLATARERALERWREVPPGRIREFEARRLRSAPTLAAGQLVNDDGSPAVRQGEFHKLWPHGAGLGLLALLRDSQLCGLESRYRIATDPALADARPAARRALAQDRVVAKYID
ncbi:hypothetical protein H4R19_000199 [Coemansia spiralis]|nr:hypothetical protein H4R19_000199 [Coemansia spiralis]